MGIVPDINAIRQVSKETKHKTHQRKTATSLTLDRYKQAVSAEHDSHAREDAARAHRHRAADEKVLAKMRQEDLDNLVSCVLESSELDAVIEGDVTLVTELQKQQIREVVEQSTGREAILQAAEERRLHHHVDSDGDLDIQPDVDSDGDLVSVPETGGTKLKNDLSDEPSPAVVYRDEDGFKITRERWLELQSAKKGGYRVKKPEDKRCRSNQRGKQTVEWGRGLVQDQEQLQREEEERRIAAQPLTRHEIDEVADREFRNAVRWDDPMRQTISQFQGSERTRSIQSEAKPKCRFPTPPNRFGIEAGYRWDGVIRGNGYEEKLLKSVNKRKHQEQDLAYKWSVEDL